MKEWLPQRVTAAGVLACGLRRPNGRLAVQCADASCPPAAMENLLRQLDSLRALFPAIRPHDETNLSLVKTERDPFRRRAGGGK